MSELDEELAALTDALLNGYEPWQASDGNRALVSILHQLYLTIAPGQTPDAEFEQRLTARLSSEWDRMYGQTRLRLLESPPVRVAAAAAAVVLVLAALLEMTAPAVSGQITGAALPVNVVIAGAALALFAVLVIVLVRSRH